MGSCWLLVMACQSGVALCICSFLGLSEHAFALETCLVEAVDARLPVADAALQRSAARLVAAATAVNHFLSKDALQNRTGVSNGGTRFNVSTRASSTKVATAGAAPGARVSSAPANVELVMFPTAVDVMNCRVGHFAGEVIMNARYRTVDFPFKLPTIELVDGTVLWSAEERVKTSAGFSTMTRRMAVVVNFDGDYSLFPFDEQIVVVAAQLGGLDFHEAQFLPWSVDTAPHTFSYASSLQPSGLFKPEIFVYSSSMTIVEHREFGLPHNKSRAKLRLLVRRDFTYHVVTSILIPGVSVTCAAVSFGIPIALIVPRTLVSFTSFLAMFVHVKQVVALVPEGVWCWLLMDLLYLSAILSAAITSNLLSAWLHHNKFTELCLKHDSLLMSVLPAEFVVGQMLVYFLRAWHMQVATCLIAGLVLVHSCIGVAFIQRAEIAKQGLFRQGLKIIAPLCLDVSNGALEQVMAEQGSPGLGASEDSSTSSSGNDESDSSDGLYSVVIRMPRRSHHHPCQDGERAAPALHSASSTEEPQFGQSRRASNASQERWSMVRHGRHMTRQPGPPPDELVLAPLHTASSSVIDAGSMATI